MIRFDARAREVLLPHWRLGIHLVFRTRRFGVNGRWWSPWPSPWGLPLHRVVGNVLLVLPLWRQFRMVRLRMSHSHGWVPAKDYEAAFGPKRLYTTARRPSGST